VPVPSGAYPELPDPSPLAFYLLESPWQLLVLLTVSGLVLLYQANQARNKRFMYAGIACIALGTILLIVASCLTTPREEVIKRTRLLISLTAPLVADNIKPLLTPDCTFKIGPGNIAPTLTVAQLENYAKGVKVEVIDSHSISRLDCSIDATASARTQIWLKTYVKSSAAGDGIPASTRWELQWVLVDNQWKLRSALLLERESPL
jgi:Na+/proline symporter